MRAIPILSDHRLSWSLDVFWMQKVKKSAAIAGQTFELQRESASRVGHIIFIKPWDNGSKWLWVKAVTINNGG